MERGRLSDTALSSSYDDVIWLYLFQDFSGSAEDRAAQRVAIRFGISSWPQHFLIDPRNFEVLADTDRSLDTFRAAIEVAKPQLTSAAITPSPEALLAADQLAEKLETEKDADLARNLLDHDDLVVRFRAIETLAELDPQTLVKRANKLLATQHDQTRYAICAVLQKSGDQTAAPALEKIVQDPGPNSRNPNVARIRAVQALATCGTPHSLKTIAPHAASRIYYNGLTGVSLDTIIAIAKRYPDKSTTNTVKKILLDAFPMPPAPDAPARDLGACTRLAQRINNDLKKITGKTVEFPTAYTTQTRTQLINAW